MASLKPGVSGNQFAFGSGGSLFGIPLFLHNTFYTFFVYSRAIFKILNNWILTQKFHLGLDFKAACASPCQARSPGQVVRPPACWAAARTQVPALDNRPSAPALGL